MDRRAFITGVTGGLVIAQSAAEAQSAAKVYRAAVPQALPLRAMG